MAETFNSTPEFQHTFNKLCEPVTSGNIFQDDAVNSRDKLEKMFNDGTAVLNTARIIGDHAYVDLYNVFSGSWEKEKHFAMHKRLLMSPKQKNF